MADETMTRSQARGNVQNWANKAAGKPQLDIDIPAEEQGVYDYMDRYYPNYVDELNKATYGYGDYLNDKTSNYSDRVGKFHDIHRGTLKNELQRIHPDWDDEMLNGNTNEIYNRWITSKQDGVTPAQSKAADVMNWEDTKNRNHNNKIENMEWTQSLLNTPPTKELWDNPKYSNYVTSHAKELADMKNKDALDRKNALQNIQNTVKDTGKSEMDSFTDSLNDYMDKNKKGREDIPATYKR